ncbi:MAG: hemolysin secretion protein D [Alphaproteobacteria bacterium 13_2_20CM_2_64_7]|jgi:HlyD family secretion protein|nr:MAG: hemolysin secretion protein D [Alphaproteobacteria bacterium 13_2_20CM_2_64_7]
MKVTSATRRSMRRHLLVAVVVVSILIVGVGGWGATAVISGAVVASGSLVVDSNVKKVQHLTGGIVGELRVRDGDRVRAADIVVRLDETVTRANLAIVTKGLGELMARKARLEGERDGLDAIIFPAHLLAGAADPDSAAAMDSERKLFNLRKTARSGQKAQLKERIAQLQEEITGLTAQQNSKAKEITLIERELAGVRELWKKNLVQLTRLTALEREATRLDGERGQLIAAAAQAKGKIAETALQILQIDQDIAAEDQLKRIDIRSPQDGTVFQLAVHTVGGVITAGDPIMLIVPEADNLSVEVKVNPQDIDQVQLNQKAILRFSAFNIRTTPEIEGVVTRISADTSTDQRTGQSYYTIRIAMAADQVERLGDVKLLPGMPVEAFVQTGDRTMFSYLVKPLHDQFVRAFREK